MHPADQVVAFLRLSEAGVTVAAIAARFGVAERLVEQRLSLGGVAPELLDAYRAQEMDLDTLKAFTVTIDHARQKAVWEQVKEQGYGPSGWQVKRMLTEESVPAASAVARFVGMEAYEAAGGTLTRDLFAGEDGSGTWFDDPVLLNELATEKLRAAADDLTALEMGQDNGRGRLERGRGLREDIPRAGGPHRGGESRTGEPARPS